MPFCLWRREIYLLILKVILFLTRTVRGPPDSSIYSCLWGGHVWWYPFSSRGTSHVRLLKKSAKFWLRNADELESAPPPRGFFFNRQIKPRGYTSRPRCIFWDTRFPPFPTGHWAWTSPKKQDTGGHHSLIMFYPNRGLRCRSCGQSMRWPPKLAHEGAQLIKRWHQGH